MSRIALPRALSTLFIAALAPSALAAQLAVADADPRAAAPAAPGVVTATPGAVPAALAVRAARTHRAHVPPDKPRPARSGDRAGLGLARGLRARRAVLAQQARPAAPRPGP